ncbi:MAG: pantetheine-phosphate adenylyltransferase [Acidobacteria bacterium]|nr:pantetheine-phosphate adenylyltransferase [Acidobacteriota bacterium]
MLAVYPGSYDPITNGHVDIIERGRKIFDRLIIAVLMNPAKQPLFTLEERIDVLRELYPPDTGIVVEAFDGLLIDFAATRKADVIVRGIRYVSDFEYEFQMALMNRRLDERIETVFMLPSESYSYVSSRLVKEIFQFGGSVSGLVPDCVERRLKSRVT